MPTFAVTIEATVIKTLTVVAADEDSATELAHEVFSVEADGVAERYEQDVRDVALVTVEDLTADADAVAT